MNKKVLSYLVLGSLVASLTGGCGQGGTAPQQTEAAKSENTETTAAAAAETTTAADNSKSEESATVTWWTWSTEAKDVYEKYAQMVTEKYPNIEVKLEFIQNADYWTKLPIAIAGGSGPDIYQMTRPSFEMYAATKQAADLTGILESNAQLKANLDAMDSVLVEDYRYDGIQMAIPYTVESTAIVYNKDMFKAAGLQEPKEIEDTWTWDDLREMAKQLTIKGDSVSNSQYGFFCDVNKIPSWELMLSRGKWIFSDDGQECTLADPEIIDAMKPLVAMYVEDEVAPTTDVSNAMSANDLFMTGRIAMMAAGSWNLITFSKIEGFEWDCAELPLDPKTGNRVCSSNVLGYMVNPNTKNMDAVGKVLEVFTSEEAQKELAATGTYIPAVVDARDAYFEMEDYPENAKAFQRALEYVHPNRLTQFIPYQEYNGYYKDAMTSIYGGEDLETTFQQLQEKINGVMEANKKAAQ